MAGCCYKAYHESEERYAKVEIVFQTIADRKKLCDTISSLILETKVSPETTISQDKGKESGEYCIEFHDDYDKESGDFFEELLTRLDIGACEIG